MKRAGTPVPAIRLIPVNSGCPVRVYKRFSSTLLLRARALRPRPGPDPRMYLRFVCNRFYCVVNATLALILIATSFPADADRRALSRLSDVVTVAGAQLPGLRGKDLAGIRVFGFREGVLAAIPFQVDQRNSTGNWVWDTAFENTQKVEFEDDFEFEETPAPGIGRFQVHDDEDPPGEARLDDNDVLVFLAKDAGGRGDANEILQGEDTVIEIEILDPVDGATTWVYVAYYDREPPPYSSVRYVSHSPRERQIDTSYYQFNYSGTCIVCIENLRIQGAPMVDRINVRGKVRADLGFIRRDIRFSETDIYGYVEGIIQGPVRIIKRHVVHLELWNLIRTADVTCDHYYYPAYAEIPICLPIRFPITEASVFLLTELHDTPLRRTLIGGSDGHIAEYSESVHVLDIDHRLHMEWIAFDSPQGSVVSFVELPGKIAAHAEARPCLCDQGAGALDAEISAVAGPVAGFVVKSGKDCPKGPHVLHGTYVISAHPYRPGDEERAHNLAHTPLTTSATLLTAEP